MQIITVILLAVTILPIPHDPDTVNRHEAELIAKTIWGEARGCSRAGQEAIAWCILNRVGTDGYGMGHSIEYVITFPDQFHGYDPENPVDPVDPEIYTLACRVIQDWQNGGEGIGKQWLWFTGDGSKNTFRDAYKGGNTKTF